MLPDPLHIDLCELGLKEVMSELSALFVTVIMRQLSQFLPLSIKLWLDNLQVR